MKQEMRYKVITLGFFIALIALCMISKECSAQKDSITFSAYEKAKVKEKKDFNVNASKIIRASDSTFYQVFMVDLLKANNIDLMRISMNGDSLQIKDDKIVYKLKRKKK